MKKFSPSFRAAFAGVFVVSLALALGGCKTPEELALGKRKKIHVAKSKNSGKKAESKLEPGWNPNFSISKSSTGRKDAYSLVPMSEPYIAMTFDDGPHPANTPQLLDILKQRNIKATFYVVGANARRYPQILRRIVAEGHEIGNHTDSHAYLTKLSQDGVRRELAVTHQAIVSATGIAPRTMRPPYGAISSELKASVKREFGYPSILWSVDPEDWKRPGSSVVASRLVSGARPGGILLAHDIHSPTIDAMPSALDQLLAKGYRFVTVTQLIAMEGNG